MSRSSLGCGLIGSDRSTGHSGLNTTVHSCVPDSLPYSIMIKLFPPPLGPLDQPPLVHRAPAHITTAPLHVPHRYQEIRMKLPFSKSRLLILSLTLHGLTFGFFDMKSGRFDVDMAVTYNLGGGSEASTTSLVDFWTSTQSPHTIQNIGSNENTDHLTMHHRSRVTPKSSPVSATKSDLARATTLIATHSDSSIKLGKFHCSNATSGKSLQGWASSLGWVRNGDSGQPSAVVPTGTGPAQINTHRTESVDQSDVLSTPTSSIRAPIVSAHPSPGNYTGFKEPGKPSDARENGAAHTLPWATHGIVFGVIFGVTALI